MNKIKGKREFFYAEEKLVSWRIGYSLGTVYKIGINSDKYELYNFGYCPSLDEFYYNKSIRLPKKLIEYFERFRFPSEELEEEMDEPYMGNILSRFDEYIKDHPNATNEEIYQVITDIRKEEEDKHNHKEEN